MMADRAPTPAIDEVGLLVEANQKLVLSILRAQADAAETALVVDELNRTRGIDPLTLLPNRTLLLERINAAIVACRLRRTWFALLFVDLNNFKQVNDVLGHSLGDRVLALAAQRLATCVGPDDVVSRYGGDEFVILLTDSPQAADAAVAAECVLASLGQPHRVGGHVVRLSASMGLSFYPRDGEDAASLIECADKAMYAAKRHEARNDVLFPPLDALHLPLAEYQQAVAAQEARLAHLQETNEQLLLAALNEQELRAAAEAAHRQLTEFLAMLAHELRNPLAPIRSAAALINGVPADKLPALQAVIERQVVHITRLVGDLLDVSRANIGKLHLQPEAIDMTDVIEAAVETCRPSMDIRLQTFTVKLPARALMLHGDPVRLTQVLTNLLDNSSKYTPVGGRIDMKVCVHGDELELIVSDTGIGISSTSLPQIFKPFVQDSHAVAFSGSGLGIGLTVVRELVEAHGGSVVASSEGADKGSHFTVTLPLATD
jgi:diguanylate cyclase (GGDEF)-like protein